MQREEIPLESPIDTKIAWAEERHLEVRDDLLGDAKIVELLKGTEEAINASHKEMAKAGVVNECQHCEKREGGSCCGAGLENKYDGTLLLINILMGVALPRHRYDPSSCFFLAEKGCLLQARHVICVNYLCKKVTDRTDPHKIAALREREGVELERLFHLQETIKKRLKAYS